MDAIVALSRERIENGSMSFFRAARLFPTDLRESAYLLYAWCRHCDDEIDGQILGHASPLPDGAGARNPREEGPAPQEERLAVLREKTMAALAGEARDPVFIGLQRVVKAHGICERYPLDLIEGMAMDVRGRTYACLDDTLNYAYHVAGVVGLMMAGIMGVRDRATLERACDLGIAFQLTNIARDVVPDAVRGRVYLPADWLANERVPVSETALARHRPAVFKTTERLLAVADEYYVSAAGGVGRLPYRAAWAVAAARRVYWGIGSIIRERGEAAWDCRASASRASHLAALAIASAEAAALIAMNGRRRPKPRIGLWTPSHLWLN
ncbi:phytoene/squalene synthase family protein [Methylocapsa palsarum]|uniref:Phytoene synthase n=1 Tax=Methylocapsa palsarum TaxID=1612308 RepID=A0A1I4BAN5_9HYPH|nr:phytoene/squalene synthase family protein [Methylocapsa palsarum]SFK65862.1 phytoene synthase [Methylocapsa palsarum]